MNEPICFYLDGCTSPDKPYILMYLPKEQHITRIQVKARAKKRPIQSFYMYYMAWRQWIPYQVNGKTQVLFVHKRLFKRIESA